MNFFLENLNRSKRKYLFHKLVVEVFYEGQCDDDNVTHGQEQQQVVEIGGHPFLGKDDNGRDVGDETCDADDVFNNISNPPLKHLVRCKISISEA